MGQAEGFENAGCAGSGIARSGLASASSSPSSRLSPASLVASSRTSRTSRSSHSSHSSIPVAVSVPLSLSLSLPIPVPLPLGPLPTRSTSRGGLSLSPGRSGSCVSFASSIPIPASISNSNCVTHAGASTPSGAEASGAEASGQGPPGALTSGQPSTLQTFTLQCAPECSSSCSSLHCPNAQHHPRTTAMSTVPTDPLSSIASSSSSAESDASGGSMSAGNPQPGAGPSSSPKSTASHQSTSSTSAPSSSGSGTSGLSSGVGVTLSAAAFPHILSAVLAASPRSTLLAFRATSRAMCDTIDAQLAYHLVFEQVQVQLQRTRNRVRNVPDRHGSEDSDGEGHEGGDGRDGDGDELMRDRDPESVSAELDDSERLPESTDMDMDIYRPSLAIRITDDDGKRIPALQPGTYATPTRRQAYVLACAEVVTLRGLATPRAFSSLVPHLTATQTLLYQVRGYAGPLPGTRVVVPVLPPPPTQPPLPIQARPARWSLGPARCDTLVLLVPLAHMGAGFVLHPNSHNAVVTIFTPLDLSLAALGFSQETATGSVSASASAFASASTPTSTAAASPAGAPATLPVTSPSPPPPPPLPAPSSLPSAPSSPVPWARPPAPNPPQPQPAPPPHNPNQHQHIQTLQLQHLQHLQNPQHLHPPQNPHMPACPLRHIIPNIARTVGHTRHVVVGLELVDRTGDRESLEIFQRHVVRAVLLEAWRGDWYGPADEMERMVADHIEFVSHEEYARRVGREQYALETRM